MQVHPDAEPVPSGRAVGREGSTGGVDHGDTQATLPTYLTVSPSQPRSAPKVAGEALKPLGSMTPHAALTPSIV